MFDCEKQNALNDDHAKNPRVGDYWHEMHCPIARVLMVDDQHVLMQDLAGRGGTEVSVTDPKPRVVTRQRFNKLFRYNSMPEKTSADVVPEYFAKQRRAAAA